MADDGEACHGFGHCFAVATRSAAEPGAESEQADSMEEARQAAVAEEIRELLMDGDRLGHFSRHIGHGTHNVNKNLLLLCIDVEAFRSVFALALPCPLAALRPL